jgi:hypothetical protein
MTSKMETNYLENESWGWFIDIEPSDKPMETIKNKETINKLEKYNSNDLFYGLLVSNIIGTISIIYVIYYIVKL